MAKSKKNIDKKTGKRKYTRRAKPEVQGSNAAGKIISISGLEPATKLESVSISGITIELIEILELKKTELSAEITKIDKLIAALKLT